MVRSPKSRHLLLIEMLVSDFAVAIGAIVSHIVLPVTFIGGYRAPYCSYKESKCRGATRLISIQIHMPRR